MDSVTTHSHSRISGFRPFGLSRFSSPWQGQRCRVCCPDGSIGTTVTGAYIIKVKGKLGLKIPVVAGVYVKPFGEGEYGGSERLSIDGCTGQTTLAGCRWIRFAGGIEGCAGSPDKSGRVCVKGQGFWRKQWRRDVFGRETNSACTGWRVSVEACFFWRCYEYIFYQVSSCDDVGGG